MTSKDIQTLIGKKLFEGGHSPICFNYSGAGLDECDIISVSKSGLTYEYEIKISRSDFKADFKKVLKHKALESRDCTRKYYIWKSGYQTTELELYLTTASYFNYAVPADMIGVSEVPEYAGLTYVHEDGRIEVIKKAPLLHKEKAPENLLKSISRNLTSKMIFGGSYMNYKRKEAKQSQ